jgi:hypothetical protein
MKVAFTIKEYSGENSALAVPTEAARAGPKWGFLRAEKTWGAFPQGLAVGSFKTNLLSTPLHL